MAQNVVTGFPYFSGFESASDTALWHISSNAGANNWCIGTAASAVRDGQRSLYVSNNGNDYYYATSNNAGFSYATLVVQVEDTEDYEFRFDWKCNGESSWDFMRAWLAPGVFTPDVSYNPVGTTSRYHEGNPEGWMPLSTTPRLNLSAGWHTQVSAFSLTPGFYTVVFMWRNDNSGGLQPPAAIDNFHIVKHTCDRPTNLVASAGPYSIDLNWQAGEQGATYSVLLNDSLIAFGLTGNAYTIINLQPNTEYNVSVVTNCMDGEVSAPAMMNVRTRCAPVVELPLFTDFETLPEGTNVIPECWQVHNSISSNYPYVNTFAGNAHSGSNSLYWYLTPSSISPDSSMVVLPWIDTSVYPINTVGISFWIKKNTSTRIRVQVGTILDPDDPSTFVADTTLVLDNTFYRFFRFRLGRHSNLSSSHVAFLVLRPSDYTALYIDDVTLVSVPPCVVPESIQVDSADFYSADVQWVDSTSEAWEIRLNNRGHLTHIYVTQNLVERSGDTVRYHINGLSHTSGYTMEVRSLCLYGDTSDWSLSLRFHTDCMPFQLPWTEDFSSNSHTAACWDMQSSNGYNLVNFITHNGHQSLRFSSSHAADDYHEYAYSPQWIYNGIDSLMVDIFYSNVSNRDTLFFGYVDDMGNTVWDLTPCISPNDTTFMVYSAMLPPSACRVAIQYHGVSASYAFVDSVSVIPHAYVPPVIYTVNGLSNNTSYGSVHGSGRYKNGTEVQLVAVPAAKYELVHWSNGSTDDTIRFVVTQDTTLTAIFKHKPCHVYAMSSDSTMGVVTGGGSYQAGDVVVLMATANPGHRLISWSDGSSSPIISFVVRDDVSYMAFFDALDIDDITASDAQVSVQGSSIVVTGAEGATLNVYDASGRCLHTLHKASSRETFTMASSGIYMVKVGRTPARRVTVSR